jgi:hypothetical protein
MSQLDVAMTEFINWACQRGLSDQMMERYMVILEQFSTFMKNRKRKDISKQDIERFIAQETSSEWRQALDWNDEYYEQCQITLDAFATWQKLRSKHQREIS